MLVWGTSGRQFESGHPDQETLLQRGCLSVPFFVKRGVLISFLSCLSIVGVVLY